MRTSVVTGHGYQCAEEQFDNDDNDDSDDNFPFSHSLLHSQNINTKNKTKKFDNNE